MLRPIRNACKTTEAGILRLSLNEQGVPSKKKALSSSSCYRKVPPIYLSIYLSNLYLYDVGGVGTGTTQKTPPAQHQHRSLPNPHQALLCSVRTSVSPVECLCTARWRHPKPLCSCPSWHSQAAARLGCTQRSAPNRYGPAAGVRRSAAGVTHAHTACNARRKAL